MESKMAGTVNKLRGRIDDNLTKLGQLQKDMEATRLDIFEKMT